MKTALLPKAFIVLAALLFSITSCFGQDKPSELVVGKWTKSMNGGSAFFLITAENKYEVEITGDETPDVWGSWVIAENKITFTDEGGEYSSGESGVYEFKAVDKSLTFTIVDDPVEGRSMVLKGAWTRAGEEN